MSKPGRNAKNLKTAVTLFGIVGGMVGLAFASVPLYQLFCQVTGFGGTTRVAEAAPGATGALEAREITVRFDANVNSKLPWAFSPDQRLIVSQVGVESLATYTAKNTSDQPIVGTASFNVTPHKAGIYFSKMECFCFTEQRLEPGESISMPVSFYVDPEIATDPNTQEITTITLSYTFFKAHDQQAALGGDAAESGS